MMSLASARSVDFFESAVQAAPVALAIVDREGRVVFANAEMEKMFGYGPHELIGQPVEVLVPDRYRPNHPEKRERFFTAPAAVSMGIGLELFGLRKDRIEVPIEIRLNPLVTPDGTYALATILNQAERRHADAVLMPCCANRNFAFVPSLTTPSSSSACSPRTGFSSTATARH